MPASSAALRAVLERAKLRVGSIAGKTLDVVEGPCGPDGKRFAFTPDYQQKLHELRIKFRYRSVTNLGRRFLIAR